jgi:hypothetical protein
LDQSVSSQAVSEAEDRLDWLGLPNIGRSTAKKDSGAFLNLFKEFGAFNLLRKEP